MIDIPILYFAHLSAVSAISGV